MAEIILNTSVPSSNTTSRLCTSHTDTAFVKALKLTAYLVMFLFSLVGNLLIANIVYKNHRLRTSVNYFIVNMATSDIIILLIAIPVRMRESYIGDRALLFDGDVATISCKMEGFLENTAMAVSIQTLVVIALDRFYGIVYPMRLALFTNRRCRWVIAGIWLNAAVFGAPVLYAGQAVERGKKLFCEMIWEPAFDTKQARKIYLIVATTTLFFLPLISLAILYSSLVLSIRLQKGQNPSQSDRHRRIVENRKVTVMLLTVVVFFTLSWTPVHVYYALYMFVWGYSLPCGVEDFLFTADFLSFSCAAVNPVIYYAFNVHYRQGLKEFASCCARIRAPAARNRSSRSSFHTSDQLPQTREIILKSVKRFELQ